LANCPQDGQQDTALGADEEHVQYGYDEFADWQGEAKKARLTM
jgi:hypothetical protein